MKKDKTNVILSEFGDIPCFSIILLICKDFEVSNINTDENYTKVICSSLPTMKKAIKCLKKIIQFYYQSEKDKKYKLSKM